MTDHDGEARNVALIVLDTVRKDYFDEYAPRLRALSDSSFENARAASSWSVPSHTSIFTGELPSDHGVHSESFDADFSFAGIDTDETFLADLPEYRTVAFSANSYLTPPFGFDAWFDEYHDFSIGSHTAESLFNEALSVQEYMKKTDEPEAWKRYLGFLEECLEHERPVKSFANGVWSQVGPKAKSWPVPELVDDGAKRISELVVESGANKGRSPLFLFANYMDAHTPLRNLVQHDTTMHDVPHSWSSRELNKWELNHDGKATAEYARNYRDVYAASIDYLDRKVAAAIQEFRRETDGETTVVVVSDHGHNLGYEADEKQFHHTASMTEGILHTPLEIVNPPEGWPAEVTDHFSHVDLGDLLVSLARGEPFSEELLRETVVSETVGLLGAQNATWGRDFSEEEYAFWNRMMRVAYDGETKYQWNSLGETYEYRLDPDRPSCQEEVARDVPIPAAALEPFAVELDTYKREAAADDQEMDFDEGVQEQLKELGYL